MSNKNRRDSQYMSRREQSEVSEKQGGGLPQGMMIYLYFTLAISGLIIFMYSTGAAEFEKDEWDSAFQYLGSGLPWMGIIFLGIIQSMSQK